MLHKVARFSYAKVAEYQQHGLVHFPAVIRLDGPAGPYTSPPAWTRPDLLVDALGIAAIRATSTGPRSTAALAPSPSASRSTQGFIRSSAFQGTPRPRPHRRHRRRLRPRPTQPPTPSHRHPRGRAARGRRPRRAVAIGEHRPLTLPSQLRWDPPKLPGGSRRYVMHRPQKGSQWQEFFHSTPRHKASLPFSRPVGVLA
ncbi:replication initiator [Streptomyces sp. AC602_WCS936]|uniref:replication initiator n=1 Tax=Streptomyces sp. AC602_WCS936 TaxID=2823685 RepID=UPI0027E515B3|nr:replication initiator [Streptomyces sp. AC602_WCS936]